MAQRRVQKLATAPIAMVTNLNDPAQSKAVDQVRAAAQKALDRPAAFDTMQTLSIGTNVVQHNLGRAYKGVVVTPTVADATFAWAVIDTDAHPERRVLISVVGVAQPRAKVLVF